MGGSKIEKFQAVVDSAARQLVSVSHSGGDSFVSTPLLYASGAAVTVQVSQVGDEFFVTDFGVGQHEAELLGGEQIYRKAARSIAEAAGIGFDQMAFFVLKASESQLPGAVSVVANCSQEAVYHTSVRVSEKRARDDSEALYERLVSVFPKTAVKQGATISGASNTEYHVSSLVSVGRRLVAFEAVTKHPQSVAFAALKFNDLARLQHAPGRVAVVQKKAELKTYLGVLSQAADVIEMRVADETFRKLVGKAA